MHFRDFGIPLQVVRVDWEVRTALEFYPRHREELVQPPLVR